MKKVSLLLVLVFATMTAFAQESGVSADAGRKATFARNGFWDNWFVGAGAVANVYMADEDQHADIKDRPSLGGMAFVGKWINPYLGVRVKGTYGSIHSFLGNDAQSMMHQKNVSAEADVLFNATNYLCKYDENRLYNFIVFGGVGGAISYDAVLNGVKGEPHKQSLTINAGIINKFRLSPRTSLDLEIAGAILPDNHEQQVGGIKYDGLLQASLGLTYKLGKADFTEAVLMDQGLINDLNSQINRLRQENAKLAQRPESCPKCPEAKTIVKEVAAPSAVSNVVFFRLNSATIDKHQEVSIFNTAKYLKDNPNAKVKVVGYADKKTGTPAYNEKLSEKRAKNVANALITKYNVSSNRVVVEWKGDTVQPYAENEWNRVAIFVVE